MFEPMLRRTKNRAAVCSTKAAEASTVETRTDQQGYQPKAAAAITVTTRKFLFRRSF
jgi:hypothetical protein